MYTHPLNGSLWSSCVVWESSWYQRFVSSEVKWIDQWWSVSPELFSWVMRPRCLAGHVWGAWGGKVSTVQFIGMRTDLCLCRQQLICIRYSLEFCSLLKGCALYLDHITQTTWLHLKLLLGQYYLEILEIYHLTEILPNHLYQGVSSISLFLLGIAGTVALQFCHKLGRLLGF